MDRSISLGCIYLCLGSALKIFNKSSILKMFYDVNEIAIHSEFNELFNVFLEIYYGAYLDSLIYVIQYISKFFCLNFEIKEILFVTKKTLEEVFNLYSNN